MDLLPVLLIFAVLVALWHWRKGKRDAAFHEKARYDHAIDTELSIDRLLKEHGVPRLHAVWVQNNRGGWTEIDHLALCGDSILIIETKGWRGKIEIDPTGERWTQRKKYDTKIHPSPVAQNQRQLRLLRAIYRGATFLPAVVMPYAEFPAGPVSGVLSIDQLRETIEAAKLRSPAEATTAAWQVLNTLDQQQDKAALRSERIAHFRRESAQKDRRSRATFR